MSDQQQVWKAIAQQLQAQLNESVWYSTFADVEPVMGDTPDDLVIRVPSQIARDRIMSRYRPIISDAMAEIGQGHRRFDVIVGVPSTVDNSDNVASQHAAGSSGGGGVPAESPLIANDDPAVQRQVPSAHPMSVEQSIAESDVAGLNPRYTFDTFVKGSSNQFTAAAALRVAETPALSYNPLFIYGSAGLGKTHLLHAIGHYVQTNYRHHVVRYASTETFMNEFVNAIRGDAMASLRRKYRDIDVLLLDDIQFLEDKERTQEEFFHTFNALHGANKQIVITSDRMPDAIPTLEDRLRGRFRWGLITDIQPPDMETRLAILRNKAERDRADVPAETLEFIATNIDTNIRELEGALIRVTAYASLNNKPLTPELARHQLAGLMSDTEPRKRTDEELLIEIAELVGFSIEELRGKSRRRPLVTARHIAMYVFREQTELSFPSIARIFGGRDHTTVIAAVQKIERQMSERQAIYEQVTDLVQKLKLQ